MSGVSHNYLDTEDLKPQASEIETGEIAINFKDEVLFTKDLLGNVIPVGASGVITQNMNLLEKDFALKDGFSGVVTSGFTIDDGVTLTVPDGSVLSVV